MIERIAELERQLRSELELGRWTPASIASAGRQLGDWLARFDMQVVARCADGISVDTDCAELSHLPWETLHDGNDYLARSSSFHVARRRSGASLAFSGAARIVFAAASPDGMPPLSYETEESRLRTAIGDAAPLEFIDGSTVDDLGRACDERIILQLVCHGRTSPPAVCLEGAGGEASWTSARTLSTRLTAPPAAAFFMACESAAFDHLERTSFACQLIQFGFPRVVAFAAPVDDGEAAAIADALYRQLIHGRTLPDAVAMVRSERIAKPGVDPRGWSGLQLWCSGDEDSWSLQSDAIVGAPSNQPPPPIIGRRRERRHLQQQLAAPKPTSVVVLGAPGIGKSSLLLSAVDRLGWRPLAVARPWTEASVLVALSATIAASDTSALVLENIDDATEAEQHVLSRLIQSRAAYPSAPLVLAARRLPPWARASAVREHLETMVLSELQANDAMRLALGVHSTYDAALRPSLAFCARLVRLTRNPGLIVALCRRALEDVSDAEAALADLEAFVSRRAPLINPSVAAVLGSVSVIEVADRVRALLSRLVCFAQPLPLALAAAALQTSEHELVAIVEDGMLELDERGVTVQPLLRPMIAPPSSGDLDVTRRALARAAGTMLSDSTATVSLPLCQLLLQIAADLVPPEKQIGQWAAQRFVEHPALDLRWKEVRAETDRILRVEPTPPLLCMLARAWLEHDPAKTVSLINEAWSQRPRPTSETYVDLLYLEARVHWRARRVEEAEARVHEAMALSFSRLHENAGWLERGRALVELQARILEERGDRKEARELLERQADLFRKARDHEALADLIVYRAVGRGLDGVDTRPIVGQALATFRRRGDVESYFGSQVMLALDELGDGNAAGARAMLLQLNRALAGRRHTEEGVMVLLALATVERQLQLDDESRVHAGAALEYADPASPIIPIARLLWKPSPRADRPRWRRRFSVEASTRIARLLGIPFYAVALTACYVVVRLIARLGGLERRGRLEVVAAVGLLLALDRPLWRRVARSIVRSTFFRRIR